MRSTATNANSSGSPRGYADLKQEHLKILLTPSQIMLIIYKSVKSVTYRKDESSMFSTMDRVAVSHLFAH